MRMEGIVITRHDGGADGEYRAAVPGSEAIGRLTYVRRGKVLTADHTLVPPAIGGRGVAAKLVEALVTGARADGDRIVPQCSYVAAWLERHPAHRDLIA
jgi:predicted GNAT family acetyltransferase